MEYEEIGHRTMTEKWPSSWTWAEIINLLTRTTSPQIVLPARLSPPYLPSIPPHVATNWGPCETKKVVKMEGVLRKYAI